MRSPEVQIALANADLLAKGRVLLIGFEGPELPEGLEHRGATVTVFQQNLRAHRTYPSGSFGDWFESDEQFDVVALALPKERGRLDLQVAMSAPLLAPAGSVMLVGHNDAGIKSGGKHLSPVGPAEVVDYRYHGRLLRAVRDEPVPETTLDAFRSRSVVNVAGRDLTLCSYPGVFSHRSLDRGTRMLIEAFPAPPEGSVLDVGCGSGGLAATAALAGAHVSAVDTDALALRATRETLAENGVQADVFPSDVYSDVSDRYARILCNPPFHAGIRTSSGIAERVITGAPDHLGSNGELWLVANRFLDYLPTLKETFRHVDVAREDGRFRVYRARR